MVINLKDHIRHVPDFPKPGILFYDISTLLAHPVAWRVAINQLAALVAPYRPELLAGVESRGFLVAAPLALKLGCGFCMIRKKGKLPGKTTSHRYELEYGTDEIEISDGIVKPGQKIVLVDDLMATGGTMAASATLLRLIGAEVQAGACLIELSFLQGRSKLDIPFHALITYES